MQIDLQGKTALVTGAAKRIGRSIALALAARGVNVVFNYRKSTSEAEVTRAELEGMGVRALALHADLTDLDACDALIENALAAFGAIDILVNNASDFPRTPLGELSQDRELFRRQLDYLVALQMRAPLYLGIQLGLQMKRNGWGRIVNITDRVTSRSQAYTNWALYLATKYGLHGITQVLAEELRPEVTVNSVAPGFVLPPPEWSPEQVQRLRDKVPLRRTVGLDEIAADVIHLIQSEAKTGSTVLSDGGAGMHTY